MPAGGGVVIEFDLSPPGSGRPLTYNNLDLEVLVRLAVELLAGRRPPPAWGDHMTPVADSELPLDEPMADLLFPAGTIVVPVMLLGHNVLAAARLNLPEHERRAAVGLGALPNPSLLDRLLETPTGEPVRDPILCAEMSAQPAGVVEVDDDLGVRRLAMPPLRIEAVAVLARRPGDHRNLRAAYLFRYYCRRWVILPHKRPTPGILVAASVWEIGLAGRGPEPEIIVDAHPPRAPGMPEWAWCLAEEVYAAWLTREQDLAAGSATGASSSPRHR
jgi:hypothetical protein